MTAPDWEWGLVVEDRDGVRWRADIGMSTSRRRWQRRPRGQHPVWLDGPALAERGPLQVVRRDRYGQLGAADAADREHAKVAS